MSKQNLNHLLNFKSQSHPPPPPPPQSQFKTKNSKRSDAATTRVRSRNSYFLNTSSFHKFRTACDITPHEQSDVELAWPKIALLQQLSFADVPNQCPICLDVPVSPVSPLCGHCFCASCLLACQNNTADPTKANQCPVCHNENLHDLKPVEFLNITRILPNSTCSFVAIRGKKSRFMSIDAGQVDAHIHQMKQDVRNSNDIPPDDKQAVEKLLTKITLADSEFSTPARAPPEATNLFYQLEDGQPGFLAPFSLSILKAGNPTSPPARIENVRVTEISTLILRDLATRRKVPFLDEYIPRNSTISLIDVNLKNKVSADVHERFARRINSRVTQRKNQAKIEKQQVTKSQKVADTQQRLKQLEARRQQRQFEDHFFQPHAQLQGHTTGEFVNEMAAAVTPIVNPPSPQFSFAAVATNQFNRLNLDSEENFPSLGG